MKIDIFGNREKNKQFYFNYAVFTINGMLALSIGSLLPFIRDANGLAYAFCGMIVSLHSVGNLLSSFAAGALPEERPVTSAMLPSTIWHQVRHGLSMDFTRCFP